MRKFSLLTAVRYVDILCCIWTPQQGCSRSPEPMHSLWDFSNVFHMGLPNPTGAVYIQPWTVILGPPKARFSGNLRLSRIPWDPEKLWGYFSFFSFSSQQFSYGILTLFYLSLYLFFLSFFLSIHLSLSIWTARLGCSRSPEPQFSHMGLLSPTGAVYIQPSLVILDPPKTKFSANLGYPRICGDLWGYFHCFIIILQCISYGIFYQWVSYGILYLFSIFQYSLVHNAFLMGFLRVFIKILNYT